MITESHEIILNLIPYGKKRAITREELKELTGFQERKICEIISEIRKNKLIVSSSGLKGYYKPTTRNEVEAFIKEGESRAKKNFASIKLAKNYLKDHEDQLKESFD